MVNKVSDPAELSSVMRMIVQVERHLAELERKYASVGELLPHIRILHGLQDRELHLRDNLPRVRRAPRS